MLKVCFTVCYFHHGNDCAYTAGEHVGGSIENYGVMATQKAHEIGALNTNFAKNWKV